MHQPADGKTGKERHQPDNKHEMAVALRGFQEAALPARKVAEQEE